MRTSFSLSSLARASLAALALAVSSAHAVNVTVERGTTTTVEGIHYTLNAANSSHWDLGWYGAGMLSALNAQLAATGGATLTTTPLATGIGYNTITLDLPVTTASGNSLALVPDRYFGTQGYAHDGGLSITTSATLPNGRKNAASTGGSLTISNLRVDLASLSVFADITGANGVGSQNLALWGITSHTSSGTVVTSPDAIVGAMATINSLSLTVDGYNAFAQSLGLTKFGTAALTATTTFGTITTAVPEPSGWALAVAGMAGIGMMMRRRAHNAH